MTYPSGGFGEEPFGPVDPESGAVEYPPIEYDPPPQNYMPPQGYLPPPGYGAYGYGAPGYGAYGTPTTNGLATTSLVCGLVSLPGYIFCIGFPLGIIAIVLGIVALTQIKKTPQQRGREMAIAGIVVGALGLVLLGALVVLGSLPSL